MPSPLSSSPLPFALGGRLRARPSRMGAISLGLLAVVIALPVRGLFVGVGSNMEEGFMLVFPKRMLAGDVPNIDFLHLYGPGSLYALMGWYKVFGYTLEVERAYGLLQHLGLIFGIYALARVWGHRMAVVSAGTAMFLALTPIGLSALAWEGGLALGVWSLVLALRALHTDGTGRRRSALAAGVLAGLALSFRPDLFIALALAHGWVLWRHRAWKQVAAGAAIGLIPVAVHLAIAGIGPSWQGMILDPVFRLRAGRQLPRPPSLHHLDGSLQVVAETFPPWWGLPALRAHSQIFLWFFVTVVACVGVPLVGWLIRRREGDGPRSAVLIGAGLFGFGILPQALQRPDSTHLAWVACVSFSLLPLAIVEVARLARPRLRALSLEGLAAAAIAAVLLVVCPFFTYRYYVLYSRISVTNLNGGYRIHRDGRNFYVGDYRAYLAAQEVTDDVAGMMHPGESLVVGTGDLSRTVYSEVFFYYLLPELRPATYYIEMDPGLADKQGSGLAEDVASADWVILTNYWRGWWEPNASVDHGSQQPNEVIAKDFCLVGNYQDTLVLLYHRCPGGGSGTSPAALGDWPEPHGPDIAT